MKLKISHTEIVYLYLGFTIFTSKKLVSNQNSLYGWYKLTSITESIDLQSNYRKKMK